MFNQVLIQLKAIFFIEFDIFEVICEDSQVNQSVTILVRHLVMAASDVLEHWSKGQVSQSLYWSITFDFNISFKYSEDLSCYNSRNSIISMIIHSEVIGMKLQLSFIA